ncbi:hypothetical protein C6P40_001434 [Pichia californica]|uniref:DUF155 domain-containing protein n=1 Tax=Pichia californica TaxID=460514 RepID=A0A9P6WL76_9ASCO|nr:hypothetical protein C6P42_001361 [[Candida] californica]KAG0688078.1 hypothetical protein C6P40_001434 [[Candida] californica]
MLSSNSSNKKGSTIPGDPLISTAKRSPSILVTDVRKNQIKAPFAGHKLEQLKKKREKSNERVTNLVQSMRRSSSNSKYSNISVSNLTSNISDIPSSRQREAPRFIATDSFGTKTYQKVPQYVKNLPSRTSKVTQKLVLIPENEQKTSHDSLDKSTTDNIFQEVYNRTKAEKMTKEQREQEYPRVTAYLIAEGFNLKLASKFLAKYHMVLPRLYDEVLYIPYSLPLLPGENGYRIQSNTSLKMQRGIKLMENFINKSEERDHHYEFYSGADNETNGTDMQDGTAIPNSPSASDFNPSEPQFFVSSSPTESILENEMIEEDRSNSFQQQERLENSDSDVDINNKMSTDSNKNEISQQSNNDNNKETANKNNDDQKEDKKRRYSGTTKSKHSHLPDLSKHAEMFILDYGVVVFWNFSEIHEKNILADLVFAKIEPGEFGDDDDDDDDEDDYDGDDYDDDDYLAVPAVKPRKNRSQSSSENDDEVEDEDDEDGSEENDATIETELSLIIKPVPEHDIETEEFHFEYNRDVPTPRIYNDMITLKSGDHLIKLTMSHAIAQSTKLSLFESKMSNILNSISKLPRALALTGRLQNYTTKRLLTKTGRLFQLRSEVNLLSNVLDTPEYFWSIEPGLNPLYTAVRDYLEIEQRVEVINDRCKVFLDFFDILSDSLAERKMTKITKMLIVAIGISVVVSMVEILVRYVIISGFTNKY